MKATHFLTLAAWIIGFLLIGFFIGRGSESGLSEWYLNLVKSPLTPPSIVFPIVWTTLYIGLAWVGWSLFGPGIKLAFVLFAAQMLLNWLWSPLFFYWQQVGLALLCIGIMLVLVLSLILLLSKSDQAYCNWVLIPYLCWLGFATYLNTFILINN